MRNLHNPEEPSKTQLQRWHNQTKIVFASFHEAPKTMHMVERSTGIMRSNICFYVRDWKKNDTIRLVKTDRDPFTNCLAGYYSTNPEHWPKPVHDGPQLEMFE